MALALPRLYPILDAGLLARRGISIEAFAEELKAAGVELLQYRDKDGTPRQILDNSYLLKTLFAGTAVRLILNDHPDLCFLAELDGVHLGQGDLSPAVARKFCGPECVIGLSTHNADQVIAAEASTADYIAIGPIFSTTTKANPDPVVGLEGICAARGLTRKPLVAIGGITLANARSVIDAGADSIAIISGLIPADPSGSVRKSAEDFQSLLL